MSIIELFDKDFKGNIVTKAKGTGGLVIFKADWCGHCQMTMPELEAVSRITGKDYPIFKVDSDTNRKSVKYFNIQGYPTIFYIDINGIVGEKYNDERVSVAFISNICKNAKKCY